jgi:hypothetical protein
VKCADANRILDGPAIDEHIERVVSAAPPLSDEILARLRGIFATAHVEHDDIEVAS